MRRLSIALLIAMMGVAVSCEKEGEQGPEGPEGPQGEQGPTGTDGQDGQDGRDGRDGQDGEDGEDGQDGQNAQFIIQNFTVSPSDWQSFGTSGTAGYGWAAEHNMPALTQSVLDNSMIMVYIQSQGSLLPLPYEVYGSSWHTLITYGATAGGIVIMAYDSDQLTIAPNGNLNFRVVVAEASMSIDERDKRIFEATGLAVKKPENGQ